MKRQRTSFLALTLLATRLLAGSATNKTASTQFDADLVNGFLAVKQAAGFVELPAADTGNDWQPHQQLWVGVKAVEGKKRTVYYVQLTTLPPPVINSHGQAWQPTLRTNSWSWRGTNQNATAKRAEYVSSLYPVRLRVFDATGKALKEGQTSMAWGMLTNGLMDMCRLSVELIPRATDTNQPARQYSDAENDQLTHAFGGGFLWMMHMFGDMQTVPSVANVWEKAQCAIRMPGAWKLIKSVFTGFVLELDPHLDQVTRVSSAAEATDVAPNYRLPVDLASGGDQLCQVEIIVGPARGAEMLLAGIRTIRAVHPSKPNREFLAQVLAAGSCAPEP